MRKLVKRWHECREYANRMAISYEKASKLFTSESEIYNSLVAEAAYSRRTSSVLDMFMSAYSNEELRDICLSVEKTVSGLRV